MIVRMALAVAAVAACVSSVLAQSALLPGTVAMREMAGPLYRDLNRMVRGEDPFDQAKAEAAIAKIAEVNSKLAAAFPDSSKGKTSPETRYYASPKVWESKAEFSANIDKFAKTLQENRDKMKTLDGLKAAYPLINNSCNACHDTFRLRRG